MNRRLPVLNDKPRDERVAPRPAAVDENDAPMKLRIAHFISADMGVRFILLNQLLFLQKQGYDVTAICSPGRWVKDVEAAGIPVKTIPITRNLHPAKDVMSFVRLTQYLRDEHFDLVHTHTPKAGFIGRLAAKLTRVPKIVHTNPGFYFHDDSGFVSRRFYVLAEKIAAACCDLILSQNKEDVEVAMREGICTSSKIRHLGNGIDVSRFQPDRYSEATTLAKKRELGLPPNCRVVGIVGRLVREKGFVEFLEAARIVGAKAPDVRFLAVGPIEPDKLDQIHPDIVQRMGLEDKVMLLADMRTDVPDLLAMMDVVTLPTYREGMPRLPMEAGLMRKAVVTTDVRGCREVVEHGKTGLLVPPRDSKALAEAILRLLENPEEAKEMATRARARVLELFDEQLLFQKLASIYRELQGE